MNNVWKDITKLHVTTVNSDGTEGRGWQTPIGVWTFLNAAVCYGHGKEAHNKDADIDTYNVNIIYETKDNENSLFNNKMWGYRKFPDGKFRQGFYDDSFYPENYEEYQRYVNMREKFLTEDERNKQESALREDQKKLVDKSLLQNCFVYGVAEKRNGHIGSTVVPDQLFLLGLFDDLDLAVQQVTNSNRFVYKIPVDVDLGSDFFSPERIVYQFSENFGEEKEENVLEELNSLYQKFLII